VWMAGQETAHAILRIHQRPPDNTVPHTTSPPPEALSITVITSTPSNLLTHNKPSTSESEARTYLKTVPRTGRS
jgi:hypothetical protein